MVSHRLVGDGVTAILQSHELHKGHLIVNETDCTTFLQWALPQLDMQWTGFRKVRGQVCKRLSKRMSELGIDDFSTYRARLVADPAEWRVLDECCHITISRFFRDRGVFESLRTRVLSDIAARASSEQRTGRVWCAGCAAGEETYTLKIIWDLEVTKLYPGVSLSIVATDIDETMLARAREGCFKPTSLHELPRHLLEEAFEREGRLFCVKPAHRQRIDFLCQDLRLQAPACSLILFFVVMSPLLILLRGCKNRFWPVWLIDCCLVAILQSEPMRGCLEEQH